MSCATDRCPDVELPGGPPGGGGRAPDVPAPEPVCADDTPSADFKAAMVPVPMPEGGGGGAGMAIPIPIPIPMPMPIPMPIAGGMPCGIGAGGMPMKDGGMPIGGGAMPG